MLYALFSFLMPKYGCITSGWQTKKKNKIDVYNTKSFGPVKEALTYDYGFPMRALHRLWQQSSDYFKRIFQTNSHIKYGTEYVESVKLSLNDRRVWNLHPSQFSSFSIFFSILFRQEKRKVPLNWHFNLILNENQIDFEKQIEYATDPILLKKKQICRIAHKAHIKKCDWEREWETAKFSELEQNSAIYFTVEIINIKWNDPKYDHAGKIIKSKLVQYYVKRIDFIKKNANFGRHCTYWKWKRNPNIDLHGKTNANQTNPYMRLNMPIFSQTLTNEVDSWVTSWVQHQHKHQQ